MTAFAKNHLSIFLMRFLQIKMAAMISYMSGGSTSLNLFLGFMIAGENSFGKQVISTMVGMARIAENY